MPEKAAPIVARRLRLAGVPSLCPDDLAEADKRLRSGLEESRQEMLRFRNLPRIPESVRKARKWCEQCEERLPYLEEPAHPALVYGEAALGSEVGDSLSSARKMSRLRARVKSADALTLPDLIHDIRLLRRHADNEQLRQLDETAKARLDEILDRFVRDGSDSSDVFDLLDADGMPPEYGREVLRADVVKALLRSCVHRQGDVTLYSGTIFGWYVRHAMRDDGEDELVVASREELTTVGWPDLVTASKVSAPETGPLKRVMQLLDEYKTGVTKGWFHQVVEAVQVLPKEDVNRMRRHEVIAAYVDTMERLIRGSSPSVKPMTLMRQLIAENNQRARNRESPLGNRTQLNRLALRILEKLGQYNGFGRSKADKDS
jgi:hypothetical protein